MSFALDDVVEHQLDVEKGVVSSVAKAVRLLKALATFGEDAGISELALSTGLPKSTTHRVLAELIQEDLAARHGNRYRLGRGWFALQSALSSSEYGRLIDAAKRPMAELFEARRASVHLGVLDGNDVLYLEKLTAPGGTRVPTRVGGRMPATCTALGKALLAHSDVARVRSVLASGPAMRSARSIVVPRLLFDQFTEIRRCGLAYDLEESQAGVFCIAVPVLVSSEVVAAISLTRLDSEKSLSADVSYVRHAAQKIADSLCPLAEWAHSPDSKI
jgi:DNA-binding IclR family transcriptional regulator